MEATEAIKIGSVYVSKEDIVHVVCVVDKTAYDITGRVVNLHDEWLRIDNSTLHNDSSFQAWYKCITSIEIIIPEVTQ